MRAVNDPFDAFFGAGPIPPESVARRVLGLHPSVVLSKPAVMAMFRARVRVLRPDLLDSAVDGLTEPLGDKADQLAELLWARDDLLRRVMEPLQVNDGIEVPRHRRSERPKCKGCADERRTTRGTPFRQNEYGRWRGYCWPCVQDAQNAERRELRRLDRANRRCRTCGKRFTPARSDGRYCSNPCRQKAHRTRKAAADA